MKTLASAADVESLRTRIAALTPADRARWGSMTAAQMVCHLSDCFCVPIGERTVSKPPNLPPIPRPMYKWLALKYPRPWPHGVLTPPELDQQIRGTPPAAFDADRGYLLANLDKFLRFRGPWSPHPIFGAMNREEWVRWGYLHIDHHLRQFGR